MKNGFVKNVQKNETEKKMPKYNIFKYSIPEENREYFEADLAQTKTEMNNQKKHRYYCRLCKKSVLRESSRLLYKSYCEKKDRFVYLIRTSFLKIKE